MDYEYRNRIYFAAKALYYRLLNLNWLSDTDIQRVNLERLTMSKDTCREESRPKLYSQVFVDRLRRTFGERPGQCQKGCEPARLRR